MKKKFSVILSLIVATTLTAQTYEVEKGWSLLGTKEPINNTDILANQNIKNIVIYHNGLYQYSANNDFAYIPEKSGFWVYADQATIIDTTPAEFRKLNDSLLGISDSSESWAILEINSLDLRIEMKTSEESAQILYTIEDAAAYCKDLSIGSVNGWRVPTQAEFTSIVELYKGNEDYFLLYDYTGENRYVVQETTVLREDSLTNEYTGYNTLNAGAINGSGWLDGLRVFCVQSK